MLIHHTPYRSRKKLAFVFIGLSVIAVLLVTKFDDRVTSRYQSREQAEAESVFQRGWLPRIIPQSSFNIIMKNNLDHNLSEGEFSFSTTEALEFIGHLRRMKVEAVSFSDSARFMERDYWPYSYQNEDSWWTFFVNAKKGHCEYRMGLIRKVNIEKRTDAPQPAR